MDAPPPRSGRRQLLLAVLGGVAIALCTATIVVAFAAHELDRWTESFNHAHDDPLGDVATPTAPGKPQTILLIGSDRRYVGGTRTDARSDTMMLVRLNPDVHAITVMSVPRDLPVERRLPGGGVVTEKLNSAFTRGGNRTVVRSLRQLLGIDIHHALDVDFAGFRALIDGIGCVWIDVDRRYYNHNDGSLATNFADIDLQPGYQRLCGTAALAYARVRHFDTDLVRADRQQDLLRQAKAQITPGSVWGRRHHLLDLLTSHARTDIRGRTEVERLMRLAIAAAGSPVQQVAFPATLGDPDDPYVHVTRAALRRAVHRFLVPTSGATAARPTRPRGQGAAERPDLEDARAAGAQEERAVAPAADMPVLVPARRAAGTSYADPPRGYTLRADGRRYAAYRLVLQASGLGQYYGVQGTTWAGAPLLRDPDRTVRLGRRRYELHLDGRRIRRVVLRTPRGAYWVSNSLSLALDNAQMLAIARSLR